MRTLKKLTACLFLFAMVASATPQKKREPDIKHGCVCHTNPITGVTHCICTP